MSETTMSDSGATMYLEQIYMLNECESCKHFHTTRCGGKIRFGVYGFKYPECVNVAEFDEERERKMEEFLFTPINKMVKED